MIPNIFISSTIADLQYLRDALRDTIIELRYHPVMSEHGEVGYIRPGTAADSCYRTVEQCQMVVLILGKRYGTAGSDGLSVTHKEYRAACGSEIPTITFVEPQVLHYKEVFDSDTDADLWNDFSCMDNPKRTFALLDEISESGTFNAIIPFASIGEAKEKLKLQLADFVGQRLGETIAPISKQIKDILAEIRALRNHIAHKQGDSTEVKRYLVATRYLLSDSVSEYRSLLEKLFDDMDMAVEKICSLPDFGAVIEGSGFSHEMLEEDQMPFLARIRDEQKNKKPEFKHGTVVCAMSGINGSYTVTDQKHLSITQVLYDAFDKDQKSLYSRTKLI